MKKKYVILLGLLLMGLLAASCGKKKEEAVQTPQATETPTPVPTEAPQKTTNLVEMQKITQEPEINVIGTKTATAEKVVIYNKTGSDVANIYIRRSPEDSDNGDSDWGEDLVNGKFTLKTGDRATYYHEKGASTELYDIRVSYTDAGQSDCFFRMLPLNDITQISLCMDGLEDDAIPYARYVSATSKREISTLNEVMKRLGLSDDEDSDPTPVPTATPNPEPDDNTYAHDDLDNQPDDPSDEAEEYIGQSLDALISALGEPNGQSYEDEPETGETGYHYYDTFTVSTTVDEDGNEIVAGIW